MTRNCGSCGTPALDEKSVFCNQCGAQLPPENILTCRKCKKTFADPQSRFCNQCGSPLGPAAPTGSPATPAAGDAAMRGTTCPACGFKNVAENPVYCKKCGARLLKNEPVRQRDPAAEVPSAGGIRIIPDGMDELRQSIGTAQPGLAIKKRQPVAPEPVSPPPARTPPKRRQEASRTGALPVSRWLALAAVVLLFVLAMAFLAMSLPGKPGGGEASATSSGSGDETAPAPGLFESLFGGIIPNQSVSAEATPVPTKKPVAGRTTPVLNRGTTVVTDTPVI